MKKLILSLVIFFSCHSAHAATVQGDADSNGALDVAKGGTNATTAADARTNLGVPATASTLVGDCTVGPCLDGSTDGGNLIKLWAGTGSYWTALQGGAPAANRSWRLPIDAPPSAGETNVMTMDEYGQMAFLDKPSTSGYVLSSTDAGVLSWIANGAGAMVYPGAGLAVSTGSAWGTSITLGTGVATALAAAVDTTGGFATYDSIPVITWGTGLTDTSNTISVTYPVTAEAFSGSGWNGDTGGLTRNDAYDYLHQFDSNDDGKVDTIDSGTDPTVDAAGEVAVDTTSDQFAYYGGAKRILSYKRQENFAVKSPVDADDFLLFKAQQAITITDIHVIAQGGTSVSVDIQECDSAGANCATVDAAITADTDGAEDDGTLSNGTIDAGDWVKVVLGAPSGTVNFVTGSIYYTITAD